jgi:hypothetical protein
VARYRLGTRSTTPASGSWISSVNQTSSALPVAGSAQIKLLCSSNARRAFRGLLVQISVGIGMVLLFAVVSGFPAGLLSPIVESSWHPTNAADGPHPWVYAIGMMMGTGIVVFTSFQAGCWMARRSPGRELVPVMGNTILGFVIAVTGLIWDRQESLSNSSWDLSLDLHGFRWLPGRCGFAKSRPHAEISPQFFKHLSTRHECLFTDLPGK